LIAYFNWVLACIDETSKSVFYLQSSQSVFDKAKEWFGVEKVIILIT